MSLPVFSKPDNINTYITSAGEGAGILKEVYELFLIQEGFLQCTPRGREATAKAYEHLGKINPNIGSSVILFS